MSVFESAPRAQRAEHAEQIANAPVKAPEKLEVTSKLDLHHLSDHKPVYSCGWCSEAVVCRLISFLGSSPG